MATPLVDGGNAGGGTAQQGTKGDPLHHAPECEDKENCEGENLCPKHKRVSWDDLEITNKRERKKPKFFDTQVDGVHDKRRKALPRSRKMYRLTRSILLNAMLLGLKTLSQHSRGSRFSARFEKKGSTL